MPAANCKILLVWLLLASLVCGGALADASQRSVVDCPADNLPHGGTLRQEAVAQGNNQHAELWLAKVHGQPWAELRHPRLDLGPDALGLAGGFLLVLLTPLSFQTPGELLTGSSSSLNLGQRNLPLRI